MLPQYPIHGSIYFDIREWIDARTWHILGIKAQWLIDPKSVRISDLLREKANAPVTINNWSFAKPGDSVYDSSGHRPIWDKTGGDLSQHRSGRAGDNKVKGMPPKRVHELIMDNELEFKAAGLTTMESLDFTRSWSHLDCRPFIPGVHPSTGFLIVKP